MSVNILVAFGLFIIAYPAWGRSMAAVGFESLLAFLASLCIATAFLHQKKEQTRAALLFCAAFSYYAIIEFGGAIEAIFQPDSPLIQKTDAVLTLDLLELMIVGHLMLLATMLISRHFEDAPRVRFYLGIAVLLLGSLIGHGIARFFILPSLNDESGIAAGFLFGISAILVLSVGTIITIRNWDSFYQISTLRLAGGLIFLTLSVIPTLLALINHSQIWTLSFCFQTVGFFTIYMALVVPYLRSIAPNYRTADILAYSVSMIIIIPLILALIAELTWPYMLYTEANVYTIARIGSTAMSITLAVFTFTFAKNAGKDSLYPLVFIYALWVTVGLSQLLLPGLFSISRIESLVPYIIGTFFSLPAFALSARWLTREESSINYSPMNWVIFGLMTGGLSIILAEFGRFLAVSYWGMADSTFYGQSVLIGLSLFAIAELAYLSFLIFAKNKGKVTLDALSAGFLSLWIMPNLLKGIFAAWTTGWWLSEAVLLIGLFLAPSILGYLYLNSSFFAQQSEIQAKVYADLLAHDISNYHQIIMNAIELAQLAVTPEDVRDRVLNDAYITLEEADRLVRNVRKLGSIESLEKEDFIPMDLISAISETFELVSRFRDERQISLRLDSDSPNCFILANELLPDIFLNLLLNAIDYSNGKPVEITIRSIDAGNQGFWQVCVSDNGPGIHPDKRSDLFTRFMKGAQGTGLGLSMVKALTELFDGDIRIEDRVPGNFNEGSSFILTFPKSIKLDMPVTGIHDERSG
ncbi:MAG: sensor histidine kinase [Candidatus Thorarchaeota archaeon]